MAEFLVLPYSATCPRCAGVGTVFGELHSWPCTYCFTAGQIEVPGARFDTILPQWAINDWFGYQLTEHRPASKLRTRRRG